MKKFLIVLPLLFSGSLFFIAPGLAHASLSDGLIGYWTFNGKDTNWVTGKTSDLSGQGNTGQLTSMSTTTSPVVGKVGQALSFDTTHNNWVTLPRAGVTSNTGFISVSAWAKPTNSSGCDASTSWCIILGNINGQTGSDKQDFSFKNVGAGDSVTFLSTTISFSAGTIGINKWRHFVGTFDGTNVRVYLDGVLKASPAAGTLTTAAELDAYIGSVWSGAGQHYSDLLIDELRIYNHALSQTEVTQLYKLGVAKLGVTVADPLKSGLIGWWTFDGKDTNWNTNKVVDVSGTGNTGTLTNMSTTTAPITGKIGQGLKFDGVNDSINVPTGSIGGLSTRTFCAWVKPEDTTATYPIIFSTFDAGYTKGFEAYLQHQSGAYYLTADFKGSTGYVGNSIPATVISYNTWYFICVSENGDLASNIKFYVNGEEKIGSTPTNNGTRLSDAGNTFLIGSDIAADANARFKGTIDDVRVYNRALSVAEVTQLYKLGSAKIGVTPTDPFKKGLVGYWSFNGPDFTDKVYDRSGSANNGYIVGAATSTVKGVGKIGQGFKLNGAGSYLSVGNFGSDRGTFVTWVKPGFASNPTDCNKSYAVLDRGSSNGHLLRLSYDGCSSGHRWTAQYRGNFGTSLSATSHQYATDAELQKWTQLVMTWDKDAGVNIYTNGQADGSAPGSTSAWADTTGFRIGDYVTGPVPWPGGIDETRVYNRVLSATEIQQLYKLGNSVAR
jgi:hypothetical protein